MKSPTKSLSWYSPPVGDAVGYGYAAIEILNALNRQGVRTNYDDPNDKVHISWVQPEWYSGTSEQYRIGYTPWESTGLEKQWVRAMNSQFEVWTTANFCKEVYESHGVEVPITVFPHGINSDQYPIMDRFLDGKFYFLHIGEPTERKGGKMVFKAFQDLFEGNENVHLVMKSNGPSSVRWEPPGGGLKNVRNHPQVTVIEEKLTDIGMTELYRRCHCLVYPSRGEGFGLIPFQAIATGMPTIVTNGTAMADYANLSFPLKWEWTEGYGIHLGDWCEPDYKDLVRWMDWIYNNWSTAVRHTKVGAEHIHRTQTWDHIVQNMIDHLGSKIDL